MLASILIIAFSAVMFVYWFRYTCILVLDGSTEEEYATRVAAANGLCFPEVHGKLTAAGDVLLDPLHRSLERDFRVLSYLLEHAAGLGLRSMEQRMLLWDFRLMRVWYGVSRGFSAPQARKALDEMARVLAYFANQMGQRAADHASA